MNISWFISTAHLANLYYTQCDYEVAEETCDQVIQKYNYSTGNQLIAEFAFSVFVSTQWTAVYDAELQALLGLCSLCAFVSNRTDVRSAWVAVCPVQFVLYPKARCARLRRYCSRGYGNVQNF